MLCGVNKYIITFISLDCIAHTAAGYLANSSEETQSCCLTSADIMSVNSAQACLYLFFVNVQVRCLLRVRPAHHILGMSVTHLLTLPGGLWGGEGVT